MNQSMNHTSYRGAFAPKKAIDDTSHIFKAKNSVVSNIGMGGVFHPTPLFRVGLGRVGVQNLEKLSYEYMNARLPDR